MELDELVEALRKAGYSVDSGVINGDYLAVSGFTLKGYILPPSERIDDKRVFIDRVECYDKISKCPIALPLPSNQDNIEFLLWAMQWLRTEEGLKASDEYMHDLWIESYPASD